MLDDGKEVRIYKKGYTEHLDAPDEENYIENGNVSVVDEIGIELLSDGFFHQFFPWTSIEYISWDDGN